MAETMVRRVTTRLLESPVIYALWQAPFANAKVRPFLQRVDVPHLRRVLDVGCGPGTNSQVFRDVDYVGIDVNPAYVATAARRFGRRFVVGDVSDPHVLPDERFDCVFINSLMHHLDDATVRRLLSRVAQLGTPDGEVHVIDLIRPDNLSFARTMAALDRGRFARGEAHWRALLTESLTLRHFEVYSLGIAGFSVWQLVYFVGTAR